MMNYDFAILSRSELFNLKFYLYTFKLKLFILCFMFFQRGRFYKVNSVAIILRSKELNMV